MRISDIKNALVKYKKRWFASEHQEISTLRQMMDNLNSADRDLTAAELFELNKFVLNAITIDDSEAERVFANLRQKLWGDIKIDDADRQDILDASKVLLQANIFNLANLQKICRSKDPANLANMVDAFRKNIKLLTQKNFDLCCSNSEPHKFAVILIAFDKYNLSQYKDRMNNLIEYAFSFKYLLELFNRLECGKLVYKLINCPETIFPLFKFVKKLEKSSSKFFTSENFPRLLDLVTCDADAFLRSNSHKSYYAIIIEILDSFYAKYPHGTTVDKKSLTIGLTESSQFYTMNNISQLMMRVDKFDQTTLNDLLNFASHRQIKSRQCALDYALAMWDQRREYTLECPDEYVSQTTLHIDMPKADVFKGNHDTLYNTP